MYRKNTLFLLFFLVAACSLPQSGPWQLGKFEKPAENPILSADSSYTFLCPVQNVVVKWQKADIFNPAAIVKDGKVYVLFRAEDNPAAGIGGRTSRIGLAVSEDGIHFEKMKDPVLYPDSSEFIQYDYPGGCEDPRIVEAEDGIYLLAYTSWNGKTARLSIATSRDLEHWEKKGPAFAKAYGGKFLDIWSKSGSIVTTLKDDKLVAAKINDKYRMYWGEGFVNAAWSDNLTDWTPTVDGDGELARANDCFIKPDLPHEVSGQYKAGTTFIEGQVFFRGKWFLYYGTADSMVGVAVN